jgi:hypothetical protein
LEKKGQRENRPTTFAGSGASHDEKARPGGTRVAIR